MIEVTITCKREDGQYTSACTVVPSDLLTTTPSTVNDARQDAVEAKIVAGFIRAYRTVTELPE